MRASMLIAEAPDSSIGGAPAVKDQRTRLGGLVEIFEGGNIDQETRQDSRGNF